MGKRIYPRNNSVLVEGVQLADQNGGAVTVAELTTTITTCEGAEIEAVPNPLPMFGDGQGNYFCVIPPLDLDDGAEIRLEVKAIVAATKATWVSELVVRDRGLPRPSRR